MTKFSLMKRSAFFACLLMPLFLISQNPGKYAQVRVFFGEKSIHDLAALGVEVDHGELVPGKYLVNVFSAQELDLIRSAGFDVKIEVADVIAAYEKGQSVDLRNVPCTPTGVPYPYEVPENYTLGSMGGYFTYAELLDILDDMAAKYPNLVSPKAPIDTFLTHEGRPIYWLRMSDNPNVDEDEPEMLYNALHHAREPGSLTQLIFYMWYLLENYETDPEVKFILDNTELYFIPCINPDGYIHNQTTNPNGGGLWRKNRLDNQDGSFGVDLNRNYGHKWGHDNSGSSPNTGSETYRGPVPFSEPETRAVKAFCENHEFEFILNYHTHGNLLVYPWGYSDQPTEDSTTFRAFANALIKQNKFKAGTGSETVGYVTNGDSDDWMYGEQVAKPLAFSMTPEVGAGFWPAQDQITFYCRSTMWMNLVAPQLLHHFGWVKDLSQLTLRELSGGIPYRLSRAGLKEGPFFVSLEGLSPQILSTGAPRTYNLYANQVIEDTIAYQLDPTTERDAELIFLLHLSNGTLTWTDTLRKKYSGIRTPVFADFGDHFDHWQNQQGSRWGVNTNDFYSAPSSIGDSPDGDYSNRANTAMTLTQPFSLADARSAKLHFFAKWDIEKGYDYAQVLASSDGQTFEPLCGRYTTISRIQVVVDQPVFDGQSGEWLEEEMDLSDFAGEPEVYLRFRLGSDRLSTGDGFNFDDLEVVSKNDSVSSVRPIEVDQFGNGKIFPNPAHGFVEITLPEGTSKLFIFNALGEQFHQTITSGRSAVKVNTNIWPTGIYVVLFEDKNGHLTGTKRFVKQVH